MASAIEITLRDAAGKDPEGCDPWQVIFRRNGSVMHDTAALNYTGAAAFGDRSDLRGLDAFDGQNRAEPVWTARR